METLQDEQHWQALAELLSARSNDICRDNGCNDDEHNCESYAYISQGGVLHDVCQSDYWCGWGSSDEERCGLLAAIALPFHGSGLDLSAAVEEDCS
ncbi:MAG: hypothetical protein GY832_31700 [Chloroflexi bacterium]|nr:hypothetical protein [Chloroflexota bacterium]